MAADYCHGWTCIGADLFQQGGGRVRCRLRDDSTLNVAGLGFYKCVANMEEIAVTLAGLVIQELGVPLSYTKLSVTGTSSGFVEAAEAALGVLAGVPEDFPNNLVVDYCV
eukprot:6535259-Pyramimonas_sp.AAC.1